MTIYGGGSGIGTVVVGTGGGMGIGTVVVVVVGGGAGVGTVVVVVVGGGVGVGTVVVVVVGGGVGVGTVVVVVVGGGSGAGGVMAGGWDVGAVVVAMVVVVVGTAWVAVAGMPVVDDDERVSTPPAVGGGWASAGCSSGWSAETEVAVRFSDGGRACATMMIPATAAIAMRADAGTRKLAVFPNLACVFGFGDMSSVNLS